MVDNRYQKFGTNNPLFLRVKYKSLLGKYMETSKHRNPTDATPGQFKGRIAIQKFI